VITNAKRFWTNWVKRLAFIELKSTLLAFQDVRLKSLQNKSVVFIATSLVYLEHAIEANKRTDNLYHAYNLMTVNQDKVSIDYLSEMLEGQVAVLSSRLP